MNLNCWCFMENPFLDILFRHTLVTLGNLMCQFLHSVVVGTLFKNLLWKVKHQNNRNTIHSGQALLILEWKSSYQYSKAGILNPHIFLTVLDTSLKVLTRKIWLTIKSFPSWWLFPTFSWPNVWFRGDIVRKKKDSNHS